MTDLKTLESRVNELEDRLKKIENRLASPLYTEDKELMDALYEKAKELVLKNKKTSAFFLQKKLIIDLARATQLLNELRKNGVI